MSRYPIGFPIGDAGNHLYETEEQT